MRRLGMAYPEGCLGTGRKIAIRRERPERRPTLRESRKAKEAAVLSKNTCLMQQPLLRVRDSGGSGLQVPQRCSHEPLAMTFLVCASLELEGDEDDQGDDKGDDASHLSRFQA